MTTTATPRALRPTLGRVALSRVGVELRLFFRDGLSVGFIFAFPVVMLVIFGSVFGDQDAGPGVSFIQYFLAGMVATVLRHRGWTDEPRTCGSECSVDGGGHGPT